MGNSKISESGIMNWYSLRVMSGKEEKIKDNIFRELEYEKGPRFSNETMSKADTRVAGRNVINDDNVPAPDPRSR